MIIFPISTHSSKLSNKLAISMLIVFNFLCLISFCILYYLFTKDSFKGSFWDWTWDMDYFLKDRGTYAGLGFVFLWLPLFMINGVALFLFLTTMVKNIIYKGK